MSGQQKRESIAISLSASDKPPAQVWREYFAQQQQPQPETVRGLVDDLSRSGRHEHVIALIQAAILNGQAQPWMYEVLALTMQIAGRPNDEVERVLLSSADFLPGDVSGTIFLAAYLTRFERYERALSLYRQAAALEPNRPEPYIMGLKLARRLKDYDAIGWAAAGILMYGWTEDRDQLERDALNAVAEAEEAFRQQGDHARIERLKAQVAEASQLDLVVRLTWSGAGDLDLIIEEPAGTICSFETPRTSGGGMLTHDGHGPRQQDCYEEYLCPLGLPGEYRIRVRHAWGDIVGKRALLTVIRHQGTDHQETHKQTVLIGKDDQVLRVSLPGGRRKELAVVPAPEARTAQRGPTPLEQLLGAARRSGPINDRPMPQFINVGGNRPFVTGTVGYQPIVTVIPEGIINTAMAIISGDRRYVRIGTSPLFTEITDVFTFSFIR